MPEQPDITADLLVRQLYQQIDSLRGAGVDWLPKADSSMEPPRPEIVEQTVELSPDSTDFRRQELDVLTKEVAGCVRCKALCSTRTQTVFGIGPLDPELCF